MVFYLAAGVLHLAAPGGFLLIMPPPIPHPRAVILFTGACEVAGALGLLARPTRRWAGAMLALYALCVWPANIYQPCGAPTCRPCQTAGGITGRGWPCSPC